MTSGQVVEATLPDGSYAINFSFTTADTAAIASGLEAVGFRWIEVGHGVGLGAGERGYGAAAASDEEYMQAASEALKRARWGMFCIPGIARLEDVDLAARYGMGFIRVGTNVTEVRDSEPFIRRAKEHGLYVAANYMKSYALPLGYKYVQPLMRARGRMPLDVVAGFAGFHSSFMPNVLKVASRRRVDAAQLIIAMCQLDKVHADEAVLDTLAAGMEAARGTYLDDYGFSLYVGQEESSRKA